MESLLKEQQGPRMLGKQGLYGDVVEEIDYNTGRILDLL
jgi:hypothetical protein